MRGTRPPRYPTIERHRFIPARAGNADSNPRPVGRAAVHPRACGERPSQLQFEQGIVGSSPRVRGTQRRDVPSRGQPRFIPARAGNAHTPGTAVSLRAVHPRACGERPTARLPTTKDVGSSPRVRGTRESARNAFADRRFIPARAGNARRCPRRHYLHTVHPRACGERRSCATCRTLNSGSSPRVRGTHGERPDHVVG